MDDEMNDFFAACLPCTLFAVLIGIDILYIDGRRYIVLTLKNSSID